MHWVTVIWSIIASAGLTLAAVHGLVWWWRRNSREHGLFALSALGAAFFAGCELWMMRSLTPAEYGTAFRLAHAPLWLMVVALVGFTRCYLQAGRPWLAWSIVGLRTLALLANFVVQINLNYREITGIRRIPFLGDSVSVAVGVTNPWMLLGQASSLLLLVFAIDASIAVLRRGEHRKAMVVGGSIVFFVMAATGQSVLAILGIVQMPVTISLFYVVIIAAMGYELSRDLFQAMQLSENLRESEERLSLTVDATNLGLWTRDLARNEIWATERFRTMFGFAKEESLKLDDVLKRLHCDDREAVRQTLANALAMGSYELEHRIVLPDGQMRWIASRGRVEFNGDRKPTLMLGVSLDITERRSSEIETQELRREIAHGARVTMLGQLASSLAHELSQPLGAILRNVEAAEMLLRSPSPDLEELRAIVADIHKDDHRAGDVINRLRSLLKRRSLESRDIGMDNLIDEVVALVRSDCAARRIKLSTDVPSDLPLARGDRVHLLQVLLNLTINGMDAVDAERGQQRWVKLGARADENGMIEVAVSDCGHGVPSEKLAHVFEPFFSTKPQGMGMGLPISKTIVEAHGGRIWAENNADRGTTFRFTLSAVKSGGAA